MVRLTLVLTVVLAVVGLPKALQPLLFQKEPRLVMLTTDEDPHLLNTGAPVKAVPQRAEQDPNLLLPIEVLEAGPQLTLVQPYAETLIMDPRS
ncbi:hypothetical protein [Marinobacterium marinum]|uniref:Uncharacterized protein n=1 Tax=Marinobacterium marinum TaxID=2756129 RepID=A0A7W1X0S3_9GAMM|nr:hypothetical protein [Marinobacterium marinum]MBA4503677.1 hypothetical protein [Marinobacterium marinum]